MTDKTIEQIFIDEIPKPGTYSVITLAIFQCARLRRFCRVSLPGLVTILSDPSCLSLFAATRYVLGARSVAFNERPVSPDFHVSWALFFIAFVTAYAFGFIAMVYFAFPEEQR